ncbi:MAG: endolytic transglycosylase MltG [Treponema sp.]|nr:endolytic transglycosylase MltG [Treponema sp.]
MTKKEKKQKESKSRASRIRGIFKIFAALVICVIIAIAAVLGAFMYLNAPAQNAAITEQDGISIIDNKIYVEVRRGESARSVGARLESAGLIKSRQFWYLLNRYKNEQLKTGTYILDVPASQSAIFRVLASGRQILYRVTIPEGVTLKKTAVILEEAGICPAVEFLAAAADSEIIKSYRIPNASVEGYLFPDTYMFPINFPAHKVIKTMADNFFGKIKTFDASFALMDPQQLNEKVIIASIVEREYRVPEEAALMAGVFYNRLRINMALQSCATVEYIITEIRGRPHPKVLYNIDLEIRSPYNTYMNPGLPPGPISAPGAVALRAAFFPENSDFLFFRVDGTQSGRHYFSKTYDEHIRAGQLYTKSRM